MMKSLVILSNTEFHIKSSEYGVEDSYLDMELGIRRDDEGLHHARVRQRAVDQDGQPIGIPSNNSLLDSRRYKVEYLDGTTEVLTANIIAKNLLAARYDQASRRRGSPKSSADCARYRNPRF